jgi:hypothetical protein
VTLCERHSREHWADVVGCDVADVAVEHERRTLEMADRGMRGLSIQSDVEWTATTALARADDVDRRLRDERVARSEREERERTLWGRLRWLMTGR